MNHIPVKLQLLDTCLPDNFQGFAGPVIAVPVDARTMVQDLFVELENDDAWPEGLTEDEVRQAVEACIGSETYDRDTCLFPDVGPDIEPDHLFVSPHPTYGDMWLVIDREDGSIYSSWPTRQQALCEAWDSNDPSPVYAYFGIEVEVPEGWEVNFVEPHGWVATRENGVNLGLFDTELEARIAAWRHKPSQSLSEADALLKIQEMMNGVEWTPDTLNAICEVMTAAGYHIGDRTM